MSSSATGTQASAASSLDSLASNFPEVRLRFCTIGTSIITENFIHAAKQVGGFQLAAVYSRDRSRAQEFADKFPEFECKVFDDLPTMVACSDIDAVYIASPTSEHAWQSILCIEHGKKVICEKPACSNSVELEAVLACAAKHKVAFMEAMRTLRSPNFMLLKEKVAATGPVRHFVATACQLSSKWPAYLKGERPKVFLPEFSNGALMDIGCYAVHAAVALLGAPENVSYIPVMLDTGADGAGTLVLGYGDKVATLLISKMSQGFSRSEVQTEQGTFSVDSVLEFSDVRLHSTASGFDRVISGSVDASDLSARGATRWAGQMKHEVKAFFELVGNGALEDSVISWSQSRTAMKVLDEARRCAGISFPADEMAKLG